MRYLFTYGPVSVEEAESVPLKETEIGLVPEHWEVVRLGEIGEVTAGGSARRNGITLMGDIHLCACNISMKTDTGFVVGI